MVGVLFRKMHEGILAQKVKIAFQGTLFNVDAHDDYGLMLVIRVGHFLYSPRKFDHKRYDGPLNKKLLDL